MEWWQLMLIGGAVSLCVGIPNYIWGYSRGWKAVEKHMLELDAEWGGWV